MKIKNLFLLGWKRLWMVVVGWFISAILHNLISGLTGKEEIFFFMFAVLVLPAYILIAIIYSLIFKLKNKTKRSKK